MTFTAIIQIHGLSIGTPTGTVQFQIDGSNAGNPVGVSTFHGVTSASFSAATLGVGTHTLLASYSGDNRFASSSGTLGSGQVVNPASTGMVLASSASTPVFGQSVTFTATISVQGPGTGTPTGTVQFQIDGSNMGAPVSVSASGGRITASVSTATMAVGTHSITASYSGDGAFSSTSATLAGGQAVSPAATSISVSSSVNSSVLGQPVIFTATINIPAPGAGTPSGTVQFQIDGSNAGSPVSVSSSSGGTTAFLSIATLAVGGHTVTANYSGDGSFKSSSGTLTGGQTVNKASTITALSSSVNPSVWGQSVTFIATIAVTAPGAGMPSGTVQFQMDGSNVGSPVSVSTAGGVTSASFSSTTLAVGTHTVTAIYSGDGNLATSSGTLSSGQAVNKASTGMVVTASANPAMFGQSVLFIATVTASVPGGGVPSGTVQFQLDGSNFGNPVTLSGGQATSPAISSLSVSGHTIKAVYSGDTSFATSSGMLTETVNQAVTKLNISSSVNASVFGQPVSFTVTISVQSPGAGTPTGTVQFQIDGSNAGSPVSVSTSGGVTTASFSTSTLAVATHTVKASYAGDSSFAGSSVSLSGGQTVNKASTSTSVTSSLNPAFFGQTVIFTATVGVTAPGAGSLTGTVQFQIDGSNFGSPVSVSTTGGVTTASFSTATLTVATHTVAASYSGDGSFAPSAGALTGGQVVKPNGVSAALSSTPGLLSIASDPGSDAITIKQVSPGILRVYGNPVSPPATPTKVNGTDHADFNLASLSGISIQFLNGNDSVTMTGFSISGDVSISAGSGSDTFLLDTITANGISIIATGADLVGVSNVTARKDLNIAVGAGTPSVTVKNTTALDLTIQAHSRANDNTTFDLEKDTISNANSGGLTLDDAHGAGNDAVILSQINIAYQLAVTLSAGANSVTADHITATFGFIDGGEPNSGWNVYIDNGGNYGYFVYHFIGH